MKKLFITLAVAISAATAVGANTEKSGTINIHISGFEGTEGTLMIGVGNISHPESMKGAMLKVDNYEMTVEIPNVPLGEICINAFQDMNENFQLDFDGMGRPTEPCLQHSLKFTEDNQTVDVELKIY